MMRRVGPQPPEPDWDRLDFRKPNGSRQAWGYLDPTDRVIVTNDGEVFVRVEKSELTMNKGELPTATLKPVMRGLLRRTFRWVGIVRRIYEIDEGKDQKTSKRQESVPLPQEDERLRLKRW